MKSARILAVVLPLAMVAVLATLASLRPAMIGLASPKDFETLKRMYETLALANSKEFGLVGEKAFPLETDTRRRPSNDSIRQAQASLHGEMLNRLGYEDEEVVLETLRCDEASSVRLTHGGLESLFDASGKRSSLELFQDFIAFRKGGRSPRRSDFHLTATEFLNIYGYGQCHNQSYALGQVFLANGINARLVHFRGGLHSIVETNEQLFDPLLGQAFPPGTTLEEVFEEPGRFFGADVSGEGIAYYTTATGYETHTIEKVPISQFSIELQAGESLELVSGGYPWLCEASAGFSWPPAGSIGFLKRIVVAKPGKIQHTAEWPLADVELHVESGMCEVVFQGDTFVAKPEQPCRLRRLCAGENRCEVELKGEFTGTVAFVMQVALGPHPKLALKPKEDGR